MRRISGPITRSIAKQPWEEDFASGRILHQAGQKLDWVNSRTAKSGLSQYSGTARAGLGQQRHSRSWTGVLQGSQASELGEVNSGLKFGLTS